MEYMNIECSVRRYQVTQRCKDISVMRAQQFEHIINAARGTLYEQPGMAGAST
jgi:hypothetical protein